jgi:predicted nucleotidyltransferase
MAKKEIIKVRDILRELLQQRGISISKIVVFGSYAKGIEKEDSDIDIIVVSKVFRGKSIFERVELTAGIGRELVKKFIKPFDIIYYSDEEWKKGNSLIINSAKKEGEIIYGT